MRALVIIAGIGVVGWFAWTRGLFGNRPRVMTQAGGVQRVAVTPHPAADASKISTSIGDVGGRPVWLVSDALGRDMRGNDAFGALVRLGLTTPAMSGASRLEQTNANNVAAWLRERARVSGANAATWEAIGVP